MNDPVHPRLPWMRVVELARELEGLYRGSGEVDPQLSLRLARAVLDFQDQLLGASIKPSGMR